MELRTEVDGREVSLSFHGGGAARGPLERVLSGAEYPLSACKGFVPEVVLDVGAHVGAASIFFSISFPGAEIVSFEPSPRSFPYLRRNTAEFPKVRPLNVGLSDRGGEFPLFRNSRGGLADSIVTRRGARFDTVKIEQAGEVFRPLVSGRRALLKIDAEGCEARILRSAGNLLRNCAVILLEYHSAGEREEILSAVPSCFSEGWHVPGAPPRGRLGFHAPGI